MSHIRPRMVVDTALLLPDYGVRAADNAAIAGVAVKTIRRWRRRSRRVPLLCVFNDMKYVELTARVLDLMHRVKGGG